jgi:uncharacterized membrane protein (DUF373 family)
MTINDMLEAFGAFLAVLIAFEIFLNITLYIRSDGIPVKRVVATALMAISRKVIVFDYQHLPPEYVSASALVLVALGVAYWLIQKKDQRNGVAGKRSRTVSYARCGSINRFSD